MEKTVPTNDQHRSQKRFEIRFSPLAQGPLTSYAEDSSVVRYFDARTAAPWVPAPFTFSLPLGMLGARFSACF